jgi:tetratricopeptide (TPR) repeat protein
MSQMRIDVVDSFDDFNSLRRDWDAVYEADPEAHFFLSWQWLSDYLTVWQSVWFVLAAKSDKADAGYVAFLPMRMQTHFDKERGFTNEFIPAGAWFSDYTGILSRPEHEEGAIVAFAEYIRRKLNWSRLQLDNLMMSDKRLRLFLKVLKKTDFNHRWLGYRFPDDPWDHALCPLVSLPPSWDEYLQQLSSNNRQKIRRLLKKIESSDTHRITLSGPDSFSENLATLLDFWKTKWKPRKGETAEGIARTNKLMLSRCAANGRLFLPVFWHGERPVAAHATLIDDCKKSFLFFITGRDESYREMPAGYLLHAYSIRHAIAHGFTSYDFLRGNEPYKYLFAARDRHLAGVSVRTKTNRNLGGKLDPRGLPAMLETALELENKGEDADAGRAYREILALGPNDALGLYRYGRFMAKNHNHAEAVELYSRAVKRAPEADNAWFFLAQSLQSLGENEAALEACRKVIQLRPQYEEAKRLLAELSLTARPARKLTMALPAGKDAARPSRKEADAKDPDGVAQQLAAASVDPHWLLKQLAAPKSAAEGTKRKP